MRRIPRAVVTAVILSCLLVPARADAQIQGSVGAGVAVPVGDFGDFHDNGYTVRGQVGVSFLVASVHAQVGWTRFTKAEFGAAVADLTDLDVFHYGVGGRVGFGLAWVGINGLYFSGDGEDGAGIVPEVGLGLGPAEVVADYRADGDESWLAVRLSVKF